jgi:AcrR family transcriptional regulator
VRRAEGLAGTRSAIVEAARARLLAEGHNGLSTRKVAETAGVPVSQLHYHFGSKDGLLLAVLEAENQRRLERQTRMYASDRPLWERYEQACDFLEDDLDSGYVRVLQEMTAEGWSSPAIGAAVRELWQGWFGLLTDVVRDAEQQLGALGPFTAAELATLLGSAFMGAESLILLGFDRDELPVRTALRRVGVLIRSIEESPTEVPGARTPA